MPYLRFTFTLLLFGLIVYLPAQSSLPLPDPAPARGVRSIETATYQGQETSPVQRERFRYDEAGQLIQRQQAGAQGLRATAAYRYDPTGDCLGQELTLHQSQQQAQVHWERQYRQGQLARLRETQSGITHTFAYDEANRLTQHLTFTRGGMEVSRTVYTYDGRGRLERQETFLGLIHRREAFRYDAQDRLIERHVEEIVSFEDRPIERYAEQYSYDDQGRLSRSCRLDAQGRPGLCQVHTYDQAGLLVQVQCGREEIRYTYDRETGLPLEQLKFVGNRQVLRKTYSYTFWPDAPLALIGY